MIEILNNLARSVVTNAMRTYARKICVHAYLFQEFPGYVKKYHNEICHIDYRERRENRSQERTLSFYDGTLCVLCIDAEVGTAYN